LAQEQSSIEIEFRIKDTGIGIPIEKQSRIFNSFEQASADTTRKYGGTGLGLTICKRLIDLMGGQIGLISRPGEGTEFIFKLKFKKGKPISDVKRSDDKPKAWTHKSLKGLKVLLVEDNPVNRMLGEKFLEKWQVEVDVAENGALAVEAVKDCKTFDLILMDLNMPVMGGIEACEKIRAMACDYSMSIPIFALTADVSPQAHEDVKRCGMNDFISKPFEPQRLFEALNKVYQAKV